MSAIVQKFSANAATKTHGLVDGTLLDAINPNAELDKTGSLIRSVFYGVVGWVGRGYKDNKTFGF